jgi:uncharacterized membrane protein
MIEKLFPVAHHSEETFCRFIIKTISYRVAILIMGFVAIYLFTDKIKVAPGFMIVSNIYTQIRYFFHERIWDKIKLVNNLSLLRCELYNFFRKMCNNFQMKGNQLCILNT